MGEYADIKSKKLLRALRKLVRKTTDLELVPGGRHNIKLHCISKGKSFPIPASHAHVNKYIVKDLTELLQEWEVCTADDFKKLL